MKMDNENKKIIKQKSDLWTVPNILTYLRFALVVPFVILFLNEKYLESAICRVFQIVLTDFLQEN